MKKWIVLIIAAAGAFWAYQTWKPASSGNAPDALTNRQTEAAVETRDIDFAVTIAGEIGPAEQVSVRPEVNGRISELPVDVGDLVPEGGLLFTLDDRDIKIDIATRQTEIAQARLALEKAKRDFDRDEKLFEENLISREEFENSRTTYELAAKDIERAQQQLELAEERLLKTRIEAPFNCTVLTRPVSEGQTVSGSGGFNSGTEVLTIADLDRLIVLAHVNQADVIRLRNGQEVDVQIEAVPGLKVKGIVERISPQATVKNNVKGFSVRIALQKPDPRIQPGMTANISIPVASVSTVVAAPLAAIFSEFNPDTRQMERFVFVRRGGRYERRLVRIGLSDYFYAEVQEGLAPGDIVALERPPEELVDLPPVNPAETRLKSQAVASST